MNNFEKLIKLLFHFTHNKTLKFEKNWTIENFGRFSGSTPTTWKWPLCTENFAPFSFLDFEFFIELYPYGINPDYRDQISMAIVASKVPPNCENRVSGRTHITIRKNRKILCYKRGSFPLAKISSFSINELISRDEIFENTRNFDHINLSNNNLEFKIEFKLLMKESFVKESLNNMRHLFYNKKASALCPSHKWDCDSLLINLQYTLQIEHFSALMIDSCHNDNMVPLFLQTQAIPFQMAQEYIEYPKQFYIRLYPNGYCGSSGKNGNICISICNSTDRDLLVHSSIVILDVNDNEFKREELTEIILQNGKLSLNYVDTKTLMKKHRLYLPGDVLTLKFDINFLVNNVKNLNYKNGINFECSEKIDALKQAVYCVRHDCDLESLFENEPKRIAIPVAQIQNLVQKPTSSQIPGTSLEACFDENIFFQVQLCNTDDSHSVAQILFKSANFEQITAQCRISIRHSNNNCNVVCRVEQFDMIRNYQVYFDKLISHNDFNKYGSTFGKLIFSIEICIIKIFEKRTIELSKQVSRVSSKTYPAINIRKVDRIHLERTAVMVDSIYEGDMNIS